MILNRVRIYFITTSLWSQPVFISRGSTCVEADVRIIVSTVAIAKSFHSFCFVMEFLRYHNNLRPAMIFYSPFSNDRKI